MKNNILLVLLVVFVGMAAGLGLLIGIGNAVQVSSMPLVERLDRMSMTQKDIERKISDLTIKFEALDKRLATMPMGGAGMPGGNAPRPPMPPPEDFNKVYDIPVGNSVVIGKKDAAVTISEFIDLQCPFCSRFYPPVKEVLKANPDKVKLVLKHYPLPFHPNARPAAKAALAANEQGKYSEMIDALLENGADTSEAKLQEYAKKIGIDYNKLQADLKAKDAQYEKQIADDMALATQVQAMGTPTFYINGKKTSARDSASWKTAIDQALAGK